MVATLLQPTGCVKLGAEASRASGTPPPATFHLNRPRRGPYRPICRVLSSRFGRRVAADRRCWARRLRIRAISGRPQRAVGTSPRRGAVKPRSRLPRHRDRPRLSGGARHGHVRVGHSASSAAALAPGRSLPRHGQRRRRHRECRRARRIWAGRPRCARPWRLALPIGSLATRCSRPMPSAR